MAEHFKLLSLYLLLIFSGNSLYALEASEASGEPSAYDLAREQVLELNSQSLHAEVQLYNLALIDAQHGRPALALAKLRQALHLRPTFTEARRALHWVAEEARLEAVLEPGTFLEQVRLWAWAYVPTWLYPAALWMSLVVGLWKLLHWIEIARQNRAQNLDRPHLSWWTVVLLALAVPWALLWGLQSWDRHFTERATFLGETGLKAGPSEDAPETSSLRLGTEVLVLREYQHWRLVARPGAQSGWVPAESLYVTSSSAVPFELSK